MSVKHISNAILGVGVDDTTIDLFESQYPVPTGVSYNSYVILDEKTTILDTVDHRATDEWLANVTEVLAGLAGERGGRRKRSGKGDGRGRPPTSSSTTWSRTTVPTLQSWRPFTRR